MPGLSRTRPTEPFPLPGEPATMQPPQRQRSVTFRIESPDVGDCVNPDQSNQILVRVRDLGSGNTAYHATITDLGSGSAPILGDADLNQEGTSQFFSNSVGVGVVPVTATGNNRRVTVQAFRGTVLGEQE